MEGHINSVDHVDIVELYHHVVDAGIPHCRICYRTCREIKLVRPDKLLQFVGCIKQQSVFGSSALDKSACIICEGAAAATMRLTEAIFNAVHIKGIMMSYGQDKFKTRKMNSKTVSQQVIPWNEKLNAYRDRTTYKQTEVLIVDSLGLEWSNKSDGNDKGPTRVDLSEVVRDNPPTIETVDLDDYEDATKTQYVPTTKDQTDNNTTRTASTTTTDQRQTIESGNTLTIIQNPPNIPKLVPINTLLNKIVDKSKHAALVPHKMQLITGHESLKDHFVLHEIILSKSGTLSVPGLGCEIQDGSLIYNPNLLNSYVVVQNGVEKEEDTNVTTTAKETTDSIANKATTSVDTSQPGNPTSVQSEVLNRFLLTRPPSTMDKRGHILQKLLENKNLSTRNDSVKNGRFLGTHSLNNTTFNANSCDLNNISIIDIQGATYVQPVPIAFETVEIIDDDDKHLKRNRTMENNRRDSSKKPRRELVVNMKMNNCLIKQSEDVIAVISDVESQTEPSSDDLQEIEQGAPEKRPIQKGSRIDWEDKIPMDVISFMDATDPNAGPELIVPDHLPTKPPDTLVLKEEAYEVIDLC